MIKRKTSKEMMDILEESVESINSLSSKVSLMRSRLEEQSNAIRNIQEWNFHELASAKDILSSTPTSTQQGLVVFANEELSGIYTRFGNTIHPQLVKTPTDIFNFETATGPVFKNNMTVSTSNGISESFKAMLMDDRIDGKGVAFDEFEDRNLVVVVEVNPGDLLGATAFNTLEFVPLFPGSFDITSMNLYTMEDYKTNALTASFQTNFTIPSVGMERILIDQTRDLWKMEIHIQLNFANSNGLYPFGLKRLRFLKCEYNPESYVIFSVRKDGYINSIGEELILHDQNGFAETTCTDEGIDLYVSYVNGELLYPITTSKGLNQKPLSRNVKEIFGYFPLSRSVASLRFTDIQTS